MLSKLPASSAINACGIVLGGIAFLWPALANGYPLVFSDTGAFLDQLLVPFMFWDKPWIYGPVLAVVSLRLTLWLPALAQGMVVSWVLWRVARVFRPPAPAGHIVVCTILAVGSAAPWFASLLMPDVLAPLTVLTLFLLAFEPPRPSRRVLLALASFAIAAHLAHLVIAAACLAFLFIARPRARLVAAMPLGLAMVLLMVTNLAGHGRPGLSPYGSVFLLARLVADGPARLQIEETCPASGYRLCVWAGRLPTDSDVFLWDPNGPVWTFPDGPVLDGPVRLAPEASRIILDTILSHPGAVIWSVAGNTITQLVMTRPDGVAGNDWLDVTVGKALRTWFSAAEVDRFRAGAQSRGELPDVAGAWRDVYPVMLILGTAGSLLLLVLSWRRDTPMVVLITLIGAGIISNAFATGALSGPHDRYQARIAWLVLLPPALWVAGYLWRREESLSQVHRKTS